MSKQKIVLFLTVFIDLISFGVVIPFLPTYVEKMTGSPIMPGLTVAVFSVAQFFFNPIWGAMSDRFGRRPIIIGSLSVSILGYALFTFATNLPILWISRFLSGVGAGNISAAQAYISDITTPKDRAKTMGMIGAAFGLGFVIGPLVGGLLMSQFGFMSVGIFCSALCLLNLLLAFFMLPESLDMQAEREVRRINIFPLKSFLQTLRIPNLNITFWAGFAFTAAFFFFQINSPLVWEQRYKLSESDLALVFTAIGISSFVVQGILLRFTSRYFTEKQQILTGFILLGIGILLVPFAPREYFWVYTVFCIVLVATGNGIVNPNLTTLVSKNVDMKSQGLVLGLYQSFGALARILGPVIGSLFYSLWWLLPFFAAAFVYFINALWFGRYKSGLEQI